MNEAVKLRPSQESLAVKLVHRNECGWYYVFGGCYFHCFAAWPREIFEKSRKGKAEVKIAGGSADRSSKLQLLFLFYAPHSLPLPVLPPSPHPTTSPAAEYLGLKRCPLLGTQNF